MTGYVGRNLLQMLIAVVGISIIVFVLNYMVGDPVTALLGPEVPQETREIYRHQMGFDRPLPVQYLSFASRAVIGDFGDSYRIQRPAFDIVMERMPPTLLLTVAGMGLAVLLALPLGIYSAYKRYSLGDNVVAVLSISGQALPTYWLGLLMIILFSVRLRWLPPSGYGTAAHLIMPAVVLGVFVAPLTMRLVRSGMLDVLSQDYIRTARARGVGEVGVLMRHALRNCLIPVVTVLGLQFGQLLGGAIITETVFAWPGVGQLAVDSIRRADFPVTQAAVISLAVMICLVNLVVDLLVGFMDPRLRLEA